MTYNRSSIMRDVWQRARAHMAQTGGALAAALSFGLRSAWAVTKDIATRKQGVRA